MDFFNEEIEERVAKDIIKKHGSLENFWKKQEAETNKYADSAKKQAEIWARIRAKSKKK